MIRKIATLIGKSVSAFFADGALSHGAAIAYYTIFALAPVLLIAIAVAGLAFGREAAQGAIVEQLSGLMGQQSAEALQSMLKSAAGARSGTLATVIGVVTLLVTATGVFSEIQTSLNAIWRAEPRSSAVSRLIRARLVSLGLVLALGFLLTVSLAVSAALAALGTYLNGIFPAVRVLLHIANFIISFALMALLFAAIYKFLPDTTIAWRDVAIGAVATSLLFTIGKSLIGLYIGSSQVASSYGGPARSSSFCCGSIIRPRSSCSARNSPDAMPIATAADRGAETRCLAIGANGPAPSLCAPAIRAKRSVVSAGATMAERESSAITSNSPARRRCVRPRHAASLVLLREGSSGLAVLMGRRGLSARFMPGFYVCPGGRVAADDRDPWSGEAGAPAAAAGDVFRRLGRAALRETFEETGILVGVPARTAAATPRFPIEAAYAAQGLAPDLNLLAFIGRAITPTASPMRFDTSFFLADGVHAVGVHADGAELDDVAWHSADPDADRAMSGVTRFMLARAVAVWRGDRAPAPLYRYIGRRAHIAVPAHRSMR
jgi:membrane protein